MQPNRHILIHLDGRRPTRTVAISLERCVVMTHRYTPDGLYDSSEVIDRLPTPAEAREALCLAHLSDRFAGLSRDDRANVLWRLALIAVGDAPPSEHRTW
ncbi:hypothetical protein ABNQ39_22185 [Azospirillum sp. A26]|uniref:hypothetical protein n=1 Tax=Azospirillum sp. A26 TaxID=3160607 RepID=UPI00366B02C3